MLLQYDHNDYNSSVKQVTNLQIIKEQPNIESINTVMDIATTPFKNAFFWPEEAVSEPSSKRMRVKVPSVVTSKEWLSFHKNKKLQKYTAEQEKQERKNKQIEKKTIAEEKKRQIEDSKNRTANKCKPKHVKQMFTETDKDSTDIENDLTIGSYVIFLYEEEYFPGIIIDVKENEVQIKSMCFSGATYFKWPEKEDKLWYSRQDILENIKDPITINNRGVYSILEMQKYRVVK